MGAAVRCGAALTISAFKNVGSSCPLAWRGLVCRGVSFDQHNCAVAAVGGRTYAACPSSDCLPNSVTCQVADTHSWSGRASTIGTTSSTAPRDCSWALVLALSGTGTLSMRVMRPRRTRVIMLECGEEDAERVCRDTCSDTQ